MSKVRRTATKTAVKTKRAEDSSGDELHVRVMEMPHGSRVEDESAEGGRYVYGVLQAAEPATFGKIGIGGTGNLVYTISYGDIAAVVSNTPVYIFDPTRENALAHEHVIETVMKTYTIIPMSFGTVFRTDDDIRQVLR